ncbi:MAG: hypothetical protein Q3982_01660 [Phoenicibacter congonensis]|uniref:Peptidase M28 domain-containing protein n=1 Tax=Phoenicibacter congonensis TaxID=1944646 RepID=A0AA43RIA6_9ACTN|nr:hypothetical protein [Phoenicibacter congonensis]
MTTMRECVDFLANEVGARPVGTDEEQKAALHIEELFKSETNFDVELEEFDAVGNPEIYRIILAAVMAFAGIFAIALPSFAIAWLVLAIAAAAFFICNELDIFSLAKYIGKSPSQNVVAVKTPDGEPAGGRRKKIVLITNYDSEKCKFEYGDSIFKYLGYVKKFELGAAGVLVLGCLISLFAPGIFSTILIAIGIIAAALEIVTFIMHTTAKYNDGANNNAASVSVMLDVAKRITTGVYSPGGDTPVIHGRREAYQAGVVPQGASVEWEAGEKSSIPADSYVASLFYDKSRVEGYEPQAAPADAVSYASDSAAPVDDYYAEPASIYDGQEPYDAHYQEQISGVSEPVQNAPASSVQDAFAAAAEVAAAAVPEPAPAADPSVPSWFSAGLQKAGNRGNQNASAVKKSVFGEAMEKAEESREAAAAQASAPATNDLQSKLQAIQDEIKGAETSASEQIAHDADVAVKVIDNEVATKPAPVEVAKPEAPAPAPVPAPQNGGVTGLLSTYTEAENYETATAKAHEAHEEKQAEPAPAVNARRVNVDSIPALRPLEPEYGVEITDADYLNEGRTEPLQKVDSAAIPAVPSAPAPTASAAHSHAAAPAHKKRDIQLPSLTGALNSKKINENLEKESEQKRKSAVDRLGTELPSLTAVIDPVEQQKAVSNVGAFGVGEATGSFAPITDEDLIRANDGDDDIYVYDADDSELSVDATQSGAVAGPGYVDIPDTHAESIFGKLFSKKKKTDEGSFSESIGVDENWEARKVGKDRGDWSSFQDDDDWNGGAVIVSADEGHDEYAQQEASRDAIYQFTTNDITAEVWCVALGAELSNHSGMASFMEHHADELKGATFIVMDGLGAGEIALVEEDGVYKTHKVNARMKRCARNSAKLIGKNLGSASMNWTNSIASKLYDRGFKCVHVAGVLNGKPAYMADKLDNSDSVESERLMESADFVMEIVRDL